MNRRFWGRAFDRQQVPVRQTMIWIYLATVMLTLQSAPAKAEPYTDELGKCFVKATSPEDRVVLVKTIFAELALNPVVAPMVRLTSEENARLRQDGAKLHVRLATKDCHTEAVNALKFEGSAGLVGAFGLLAKISMRGLMSDPAVHAGLLSFEQAYRNDAAMRELLREGGQITAP